MGISRFASRPAVPPRGKWRATGLPHPAGGPLWALPPVYPCSPARGGWPAVAPPRGPSGFPCGGGRGPWARPLPELKRLRAAVLGALPDAARPGVGHRVRCATRCAGVGSRLRPELGRPRGAARAPGPPIRRGPGGVSWPPGPYRREKKVGGLSQGLLSRKSHFSKKKPLVFNYNQGPFEGSREALFGNTRCLESTNGPHCLGSPLLSTTASDAVQFLKTPRHNHENGSPPPKAQS